MKLGFSTSACPGWDLETVIRQAASLGYQGVELSGLPGEGHLPASPVLRRDPQAVVQQFRSAGVELVCLGTSHAFHGPDRRQVAQEKARVREHLELAAELACPLVRVLSGRVPPREAKPVTLQRISDALRELAPVAASCATTLVVENTADLGGSRDLWYILDTVNHPAVRGCWSPRNARATGDRASLAVPRIGGRTALVHAADAKCAPDGSTAYALPGDGEAELPLTLDLLRGVGFDGYLIFDGPRESASGLDGPEQALAAAAAKLKAILSDIEAVKELSAYKGDKNVPRYASAPQAAASHSE